MSTEPVYIYPSLGNSYSMNRYYNGVMSGLQENNISYEVVLPKGSGLKAKYIDYPLLTRKKRKSKGKHLVISERYAYLVPFMHQDSIIVCHDLHTLYPEGKTPKIHQRLYRFFLNRMFKANKVVCVSHHTKNGLLKFMPKFKDHKNLQVVHNGIESFWVSREMVSTTYEVPKELFKHKNVLLSVGTDAWYKNNQWSLKLLADLPEEFHLLRVGSFNPPNESLIQDLGIQHRIIRVKDLSDSDLKYCYQNSKALLFPSISEGFGWPALEAALSNCAVISDGAGAISEFFINKKGLTFLNKAEALILKKDENEPMLDYHIWRNQVVKLIG